MVNLIKNDKSTRYLYLNEQLRSESLKFSFPLSRFPFRDFCERLIFFCLFSFKIWRAAGQDWSPRAWWNRFEFESYFRKNNDGDRPKNVIHFSKVNFWTFSSEQRSCVIS